MRRVEVCEINVVHVFPLFALTDWLIADVAAALCAVVYVYIEITALFVFMVRFGKRMVRTLVAQMTLSWCDCRSTCCSRSSRYAVLLRIFAALVPVFFLRTLIRGEAVVLVPISPTVRRGNVADVTVAAIATFGIYGSARCQTVPRVVLKGFLGAVLAHLRQ